MRALATIVLISLACMGQARAESDQDSRELQGMFSSSETAAQFYDCRTGQSVPVAKSGPYAALERAYLESRTPPGEGLMVAIRGRYLERPATDAGASEVMLVVDSFEHVIDTGDCAPAGSATLRDTHWKLVEIDGKSITTPAGQKGAYLVLSSDNSKVHGFAGCNNFFGQYSSDGEVLMFSGLGSTMMACPDGMDTELAFLQALGETNRAIIDGSYLQLYITDHLLARLEATPQ
jgi:heat shock protein HslJ